MSGDLRDQSDPAAFHFGVPEDYSYFSAHSIEQRNRRLALNNFFRVVENYRVAKLYLRNRIRVGGNEQYDLIFTSQVSRHRDELGMRHAGWQLQHRANPKPDWHKDCMFFDICEVVEGPEGVIPSFVWLEPTKERSNLAGDILHTVDFVGPEIGILREGEGRVIDIAPSMSPLNNIGHMIQTGSKVVNCIEHDGRDIDRKTFVELGFQKMLSEMRVVLNNQGVWLVWPECLNGLIQICDMVICAADDSFGAGKQVRHGKRPNKRPGI